MYFKFVRRKQLNNLVLIPEVPVDLAHTAAVGMRQRSAVVAAGPNTVVAGSTEAGLLLVVPQLDPTLGHFVVIGIIAKKENKI